MERLSQTSEADAPLDKVDLLIFAFFLHLNSNNIRAHFMVELALKATWLQLYSDR